MSRKITGSVRWSADGTSAVVRITRGRNKRLSLQLGPTDQEGARTRAALVASYGSRLRRQGLLDDDTAQKLLRELALRRGRAFDAAVALLEKVLTGKAQLPGTKRNVPTFNDIGEQWTSGKLHAEYPDHVRQKNPDQDRRRLRIIGDIDFDGVNIGDTAIDHFTLEHAEHVMRNLPEDAKRPATRRQYSQIVHRILAMAVYPLKLISTNPLPKGFMPKVGTPPLYPYIYPSEEATLLACQDVPLEVRMAHGFSVREGLRVSELAALNVRDFEIPKMGRGTITLDENKTDEPRSWALGEDTSEALRRWFTMRQVKPHSPAFPAVNGGRFEGHVANAIRAALQAAGVKRASLHSAGKNTRAYRWHDARGSFITIASANDKGEAWISDRTGHKSSIMINRYRKRAREAHELRLGYWADLSETVPELKKKPTKKPARPSKKAK